MKEETILTRHPQGKKGVNILLRRYELARAAMLDILREHGELGAMDLYEKTAARLRGHLDGEPMWYAATVKADLEARGEVATVKRKGVVWVRLNP